MREATTFRFRLKDKHASRLNAQARAVNFVWNYCNEVQRKAAGLGHQWTTANQLGRLCAGATKEGLDLAANTVEKVCQQYDRSRRAKRKPWLRWRSVRSLGWIPVRTGDITFRDGALHDRDVNAARNILRLGLETLAGGAAMRGEAKNGESNFPEADEAS